MEKLNEGILLQFNATIIAGIFIFISLSPFNIFDLPFAFNENVLITPELSLKGNVVTIFMFLTMMIFPFILSSILVLLDKFDGARWCCIAGLLMIFIILSGILYSSIDSYIIQLTK